MEKQLLTKESAKELLEIKGEVRGTAIKSDWDFILKNEGEEVLKKLEKRMAELGCPIKYNEIKSGNFYPIGYDVISVQLIKELFGYKDKELEELGAAQFKSSIFLKIIGKYFVNLSLFVREASKAWHRYYTVGNLEIVELNEKEKYMIFALKDFKIHPDLCIALKGSFIKGLKLITLSNSVSCQETKCVFKGDDFCQFLIKW